MIDTNEDDGIKTIPVIPPVRHIPGPNVSYARWEAYIYAGIGILYGVVLGYILWGRKNVGNS